jgi:hypothetical protein
MKSLLKLIAIVAIFGFVSCTENEEIVTNENTIIQQDEFGTNKGDETNQNNGGQTDHDFEEE